MGKVMTIRPTNTSRQQRWKVRPAPQPVSRKLFQQVVKAVKKKVGTPTRVQQEKKNKLGKRLVGSAYGKYKGTFKSRGGTRSAFDKDLVQGVCIKTEQGSVISDTRNVTYIGHSTMPAQSILRLAWGAILKKVFAMSQLKIKNWDDPLIAPPQTFDLQIVINYKNVDVATESSYIVGLSTSSTLLSTVNIIISLFGTEGARTTSQQQLLSIQLQQQIAVGNWVNNCVVDLTDCYLTFKAFAQLKMQNRTVNTLGNDQADDVDNVPIWGRSYDFTSNGAIFRDYNKPTSYDIPQLVTDPVHGGMPIGTTLPSATGTTLYDDIPFANQFIGTKSSSKVLLNPGEIKQSTMNDYVRISLNKLYSVLYNRGDAPISEVRRIYLGKTRIFAFEKVVNSVTATADNAFKIAFEQAIILSAIAYMPNKNQTAPKLFKTLY